MMLKKILKRILWAVALLLVAAQVVRPPKNVAVGPAAGDFMVNYPPPAKVREILTTSCYDCHSNTTRYPWYAQIQPLGWWLRHHIDEGKNELNFSEFADYSPRRKKQKLETASDELRDKAMPLPSYLWIHRDARLSPDQAKALMEWFETVIEKVEDEAN
jgi:hypothetical protein